MNVYLAGPDVFLPEPLEAARVKKEICAKYGFVGQFPFDNALDLSGLTPVEAGLAIYKSNIQLMDRCDLIVANMTPFRGPSMDVGTAFEMGYMAAQGKPIFGYSNDGRLYGDRVPQPTPQRDENNLFVEQFGMHDNLMLEGAIYTSSGDFRGKLIDAASYYTDLSVFEAVIQLAAAKFLR